LAVWVFRCYLNADGNDVIDQWRESQEDRFQAKIDTRFKYLQQQPREGWVRPYFDTLSDDGRGLGELRIPFKNVEYRVIGFASGEMEYTWLLPAKEVGGKFVPKNACEIAQGRKIEVLEGRRQTCVCEFD
jgi:hypothetical protein